MQIRCQYSRLLPITDWKPSPFQTNTHTPEQVERLAKIIRYQGIRKPATINAMTGNGVTGHCLVEAIRLNGWESVPIDEQSFESEEMEASHVTADNAIAAWATINLAAVNDMVPDIGPIDIDMLGIENFTIDPYENIDTDPVGDNKKKTLTCPSCGHQGVSREFKTT